MNNENKLNEIKKFYDNNYYSNIPMHVKATSHYRKLAKKIGVCEDDNVLDVACGVGQWLLACREVGARISGIDLSTSAIEVCKKNLDGVFFDTSAECLPFEDDSFTVVSCLGSLEHFMDPVRSLREMVRVSKSHARFLILVPNSDFLTRRLGIFSGTFQADIKEDVKTLAEWDSLFTAAGLKVINKWKDLHVLSWDWIKKGRWYSVPFRAAQALLLVLLPLKWQYQVYHLCEVYRQE